MQNLPSLVAQNTAVQNTAVPVNGQQQEEQGASFKQVLSQQVEQETSKEHAVAKEASATKEDDTTVGKDQVEAGVKKSPRNEASYIGAETSAVVDRIIDDALSNTRTSEKVDSAVAQLAAVLANKTTKLVAPSAEDATTDASNEVVDANKLPATDVALAVSPSVIPVDNRSVQRPNTVALTQEKKVSLLSKDALNKSDVSVASEVDNGRQPDSLLPKSNTGAEKPPLLNSPFSNHLTSETARDLAKDPLASQLAPTTAAATMLQVAKLPPTVAPSALVQPGSSNEINVYPGKTGWNAAISQKVVWMVGATEQSATLTLNPPDLGPLKVVINVNNEKADATFISDNPEVRKALENGMVNLRNSMDQAGVQLGQANVNTGKQQQAFEQATREQLSQQPSANDTSQSEEHSAHVITKPQVNNGLVDIFA